MHKFLGGAFGSKTIETICQLVSVRLDHRLLARQDPFAEAVGAQPIAAHQMAANLVLVGEVLGDRLVLCIEHGRPKVEELLAADKPRLELGIRPTRILAHGTTHQVALSGWDLGGRAVPAEGEPSRTSSSEYLSEAP